MASPPLCQAIVLNFVQQGFDTTFPPGSSAANCANLQISVTPATNACTGTNPNPFGVAGPSVLVGNFADRDDVVGASLASSAIPFFTISQCSVTYRNAKFIDGNLGGGGAPCVPPGSCVIVAGNTPTHTLPIYQGNIYPGSSGTLDPSINTAIFDNSFRVDLIAPHFDALYEQGRVDADAYFDLLK
jgi:hypothetical protein